MTTRRRFLSILPFLGLLFGASRKTEPKYVLDNGYRYVAIIDHRTGKISYFKYGTHSNGKAIFWPRDDGRKEKIASLTRAVNPLFDFRPIEIDDSGQVRTCRWYGCGLFDDHSLT